MALTPKQEKFAQCVADGMTQADAYRAAFSVRPSTKPESVIRSASELMSDPNISSRVAQLREQLSAKALWTREMSVQALVGVLYSPESQKDVIAAVKELNAMHGYNAPQKIDHLNSDGSLKPSVIQIVAASKPDDSRKD